MSIRNASDSDLRALVKWSPRFADEAKRELDRRAAERQPAELLQDRAEVSAAFTAANPFPSGRWSS